MINKLFRHCVGLFCFILIALDTIFFGLFFLLPLSLIKIIIPIRQVQLWCNRWLEWMQFAWGSVVQFIVNSCHQIKWEIQSEEEVLSHDKSYLLLVNHQSWTDILVLYQVFGGKIPPSKYFIKKELIWVPIIGMAAWALDFPFMRRYSPQFLKKYPEKKGEDFEITRKACEKYKGKAVSIVNFTEGTRFTPAKHQQQGSPYNHLLKPKAGGISFVMSALGNNIDKVLNITIVYPEKNHSFWDYLSGYLEHVIIKIEPLPISDALIGNYNADDEYRARFQSWINQVWANKDQTIELMHKEG